MARFSSTKGVYGVCDRTGFRCPLDEMVVEPWSGLKVWKRYADPEPRNWKPRRVPVDPQAIRDPRPPQTAYEAAGASVGFPWDDGLPWSDFSFWKD